MKRLATATFLAIGLLALTGVSIAVDDIPPTFDQMIQTLKLDPSIKQQALSGEIVVVDQDDSMEKELAIGLVAVIKAPYAEVIEAVKGNRLFQFQKDTLDYAQIEGEPEVAKFADIGYTLDEADEVHELLDVKPGTKFNLSNEEMEKFRAIQTLAKSLSDQTLVDTVNETLRSFLAERLRLYQMDGIPGISGYQRSPKEASSPAEELAAANAAVAIMKSFAPNFYSMMKDFPNASIESVEHRFFVFKLNIEGRPGFVLSHRMYFFGSDFALAAERHIYAPHFYNSLQLVAGALPHEGNTVLFYGNRTYTDQVSGFGQSLKHSIGGKQLTKTVKSMISDMRDGIEAGKASD